MSSIKILAALALLATGTGNCRDQDGEDEGIVDRATCTRLCSLIVCDGVTEVGEDFASNCADRCIDKGADAQAIGEECADVYPRAVNCVGNLSCADYLKWEGGDDTICDTELTSFMESCPGLTFDFRE